MTQKATSAAFRLDHWLQNIFLRGLIWLLLRLPYRWRVPFCGKVFARIIAPLAGYDRRVRDNLHRIFPAMPEAEVRRMMRAVPDHVGRSVIEMYSGQEFIDHVRHTPIHGPGLRALEEARAAHRPVVMVTGHFGNYDASRLALIERGFPIGGLYRPMTNRYFNRHYVAAMERLSKPVFPRTRSGMAQMVRFLREGGMLGIVQDQHMNKGVRLKFFGHDALTALSAAELALKYDALILPSYAIRKENGLDFDILVDAPIPHTNAEEMTQALNDHLEAYVRQYPDQWFWIHNRWKI